MPECNSPLIICRLTDKNGKILNPFAPNALSFTPICSSPKKTEKERCTFSVLISGYIVVYVEGRDLSSPIPFKITQKIYMHEPDNAFLEFQVRKFQYTTNQVVIGTKIAEVEIAIEIRAAVRSCCWTDILIQPVNIPEQVLIREKRVYDCVCFDCGVTVAYEMHMRALALQYNALSDGVKRNYTNEDELKEYGNTGIIPPSDNIMCSLFVNGMLQPKVNYAIAAGNLNLLTEDIPPRNAPLIISFIVLGQNHGANVIATNNTYVAQSIGSKRMFLDSDEITEYGDQGIPSPDEISFYSLFINGTLQPKANYIVKKGVLELITTDVPPAGAMIVLEYFTIKDEKGRLLPAEVYEYNARSYGKKIYTNVDEIIMYDNQGIPDPNLYSFEHLFVNGTLQPNVNYSVEKGSLTIKTIDLPSMEAPITLQFVCIFVS